MRLELLKSMKALIGRLIATPFSSFYTIFNDFFFVRSLIGLSSPVEVLLAYLSEFLTVGSDRFLSVFCLSIKFCFFSIVLIVCFAPVFSVDGFFYVVEYLESASR